MGTTASKNEPLNVNNSGKSGEESSSVKQATKDILANYTKCWGDVVDSFVVQEGYRVKYNELKMHESSSDGSSIWANYKHAAEQLQNVSLNEISQYDRNERIALFLNIYNGLTIHGIVVHGGPDGWIQRLRLYANVAYNIGGEVLTMDDVENGILRENASPIFSPFKQFGKNHPAIGLKVSPLDPRIHFGINCGVVSGSSIRCYRGDSVQGTLKSVTELFLNAPHNFKVDVDSQTVFMPLLFQFLGKDFGVGSRGVEYAKWCLPYLHEGSEKRASLEGLLKELDTNHKPVKFKYLPYDWALNDSS